MTLYTKCMFAAPSQEDGCRISVMSRHTLNDGATSDSRITESSFNEWHRELAPPPKLVGNYYKRELSWDAFAEKYIAHIRTPSIAERVHTLARRALSEDITLLCIEQTPDKCHRRLLAEECKRLEPLIIIMHR